MSHGRPTLSFERIIAGLLLGVGFLVMSSIFVPDSTRAGDSSTELLPPPRGASSDSASEADGERLLGTIESGRYIVQVHAGEDQPRFSVIDAETGQVLAKRIDRHELSERFPDLPIERMLSDDTPAVMYVDPSSQR